MTLALFLTLLLASILSLYLRANRSSDFATPLTAYCFAWTAVYMLLLFPLVPSDPIGIEATLVLFTNHLSFFFGAATAVALSNISRSNTQRISREATARLLFHKTNITALAVFIIILLVASTALFFVYVKQIGSTIGFAVAIASPGAIREQIQGGLGIGFRYLYFAMPGAVLTIAYIRIARGTNKILFLIAFSIFLLFCTASTGRTNAGWVSIWCFILSWRLSDDFKGRFLHVISFVCMVLCLVIFFVSAGLYLGKGLTSIESVEDSPVEAVVEELKMPYIYATGSVPALQKRILEDLPAGYGKKTFYPAYKSYKELTHDDAPSTIEAFTYVPYPFNVYTYIQPQYDDFGWIGSVAYSYIFGIIAMMIHNAWHNNRTLTTLYYDSLVTSTIVLSPFSSRFVSPTTWFLLALPMLFCILEVNRKKALGPTFVGGAKRTEQKTSEHYANSTTNQI